jgi:hypothetical protein
MEPERTTLDGMLKTKSTDTCSPLLFFCLLCSVDGDLQHQVYLCGGGAGGKVCIIRQTQTGFGTLFIVLGLQDPVKE